MSLRLPVLSARSEKPTPFFRVVIFVGVFATTASTVASAAEAVLLPRIAIIIDDLGYKLELGRRAIALPGPVAVAVLPRTPRGQLLARTAAAQGKEVLLHLPMQAVGLNGEAEPGSLSLEMTRGQFAAAFAEDMAFVPNAVGINTHRGSLLTRHPGHMSWLMEEINSRKGLFFVDSYTTRESVAMQLAHESGVPALKRDVFLDPDENAGTLQREFQRLKNLARKHGSAVGIGHPFPATLALLESALPLLKEEGIELVSIGELIELRSRKSSREIAGATQ